MGKLFGDFLRIALFFVGGSWSLKCFLKNGVETHVVLVGKQGEAIRAPHVCCKSVKGHRVSDFRFVS